MFERTTEEQLKVLPKYYKEMIEYYPYNIDLIDKCYEKAKGDQSFFWDFHKFCHTQNQKERENILASMDDFINFLEFGNLGGIDY